MPSFVAMKPSISLASAGALLLSLAAPALAAPETAPHAAACVAALWTASIILRYPVQRQMLPERAVLMASGSAPWRS